ncbi:uncharacterized protein LOC132613271 [Lycium barbarum]|uniref:uncharacterized protein LOC132613271 n=1 Tax=Lycium barbarum TaxID=112863 RepID=UPI00293E266B|nr:uncharacterized protein LOC132613271 [Lycium barbarum]
MQPCAFELAASCPIQTPIAVTPCVIMLKLNPLSPAIDVAYYEAAGGTRKRRIYGLGSQAQSYYGPNLCVNFGFNASASAAPSTSQSAPTENMKELVMRLIPTLTDRLLPLFIEKARGVISSPSDHPNTPIDKPSVVTPIVPPPTTANIDDVDPLVSDDDRSPSPMH